MGYNERTLKNLLPQRIFVLSIGAVLIAPVLVFAQFGGIPGLPTAGTISLSLSPEFPSPGQEVTATLSSYGISLNSSRIEWFLDGNPLGQGVGKTEVSFTAPNLGSGATLTVIATSGTKEYSESLTVRPAEVEIIVEAQTHVPPFYKGKALYSSEAIIKAVALTEFVSQSGRKIPDAELIFTWKLDGTVLGQQSGTGKNVLITRAPRSFEEKLLSVEVSSLDHSSTGIGYHALIPTEPRIVFYEADPLLGVRYERALQGTLRLSATEGTIKAEGYYFSPGSTEYSWAVNNDPVTVAPDKPDMLTLRKEGDGGAAAVSLSIQNLKEILQAAVQTLIINF